MKKSLAAADEVGPCLALLMSDRFERALWGENNGYRGNTLLRFAES